MVQFDASKLGGRVVSARFDFSTHDSNRVPLPIVPQVRGFIRRTFGNMAIGSYNLVETPIADPLDLDSGGFEVSGVFEGSIPPFYQIASGEYDLITAIFVSGPTIFTGHMIHSMTIAYIPFDESPQLDLTISDVKLKRSNGANVGIDSPISLSENESLIAEINISGIDLDSITATTIPVELRVDYASGAPSSTQTQNVSASDLIAGSKLIEFSFTPLTEDFTVTASVDPGNLIDEESEANNSQSVVVEVVTGGEIDLTIGEVKIGQVFQLDAKRASPSIVQNKAADILVTPELIGAMNGLDNEIVTISVNQGAISLTAVGSNEFTVKAIKEWGNPDENGGTRGPIIFNGLDTSVVGITRINVEINIKNDQNKDSNLTNNVEEVITEVFWTNPLNIGVLNFSGCDDGSSCYGSVAPSYFEDLNGEPKKIVQDTFPVPDNSVSLIRVPFFEETRGSSLTRIDGIVDSVSLGIKKDLNTLGRIKSRNQSVSRMVGLVPQSYLIRHDDSFDGIADSPTNGVIHPGMILVEGSTNDTLAHELIHTFIGVNAHKDGTPVTGAYNATYDVLLPDSLYGNLMNEAGATSGIPWVDREVYASLFDFLKKPIVDPPVIIVSGFINQNGDVTIDKTFISDEGVYTPNPEAGNIEIVSTDEIGNELNNFKFSLDFKMLKFPLGEIDVESEPFVVSIPFSENIAQLEILVDGKSKLSIDPLGDSLLDIIESIDEKAQFKTKSSGYARYQKKILIKVTKKFQSSLLQSQKMLSKCEKINDNNRWKKWKKKRCERAAYYKKKKARYYLWALERLVKWWVNNNSGIEVNKEFVLKSINIIKERL